MGTGMDALCTSTVSLTGLATGFAVVVGSTCFTGSLS